MRRREERGANPAEALCGLGHMGVSEVLFNQTVLEDARAV